MPLKSLGEALEEQKLLWKPAKHLMALAEFVAREPSLDLVALRSFNCGFDSVSLELVRDVLKKARRTFTELKIDEIVDTAHVRIRLRTLAEAVEARKRRARSIVGSLDVARAATDAAAAADATGATAAADAACEARTGDGAATHVDGGCGAEPVGSDPRGAGVPHRSTQL